MRRGKSPQNINEEVNKMRRLMNFDISQNSHDVLSEKIINEAVNFYGLGDTFYYILKKGNKVKLIPLGVLKPNGRDFIFDPKIKKINKNFKGGQSAQWFQLEKNGWWELHTELGNIVRDTQLESMTQELINAYEEYSNKVETKKVAVSGSNWGNKSSGTILLDIGTNGTYPNAHNIKLPKNLSPTSSNSWSLLEADLKNFASVTNDFTPPEEPTEEIILDDVSVNNVYDTYCPNMVQPNFNNSEVKKEFDDIVEKISDFINLPDDKNGVSALSKLNKGLTILGQADASSPGWWGGKPCNTNIDHNYGGIKKLPKDKRSKEMLHDMNLYLATHRAKNYKNSLIKAVKEKTGKDIIIREETPIEYYEKGDSFKGKKFRSINLKFNGVKHTYVMGKTEEGEDKKDQWEKLKDLFEEQGYIWGRTNINTKNGVQELQSVRKGNEEVYIFADYIDKDKLIPELTMSVTAEFDTNSNLILNSSVGNITLKQNGLGNIGDAAKKIDGMAFHSTFNGKAQGSLRSDNDIVNFGDAAYDTYEVKDKVKIAGYEFYKIKRLGFALYNTGIQTRNPKLPSEDEIIDLLVKEQIKYTPSQLKSLVKQSGKFNKKALKLLNKLNKINTSDSGGEEIQDDIQGY
jgi:hypothetical protein